MSFPVFEGKSFEIGIQIYDIFTPAIAGFKILFGPFEHILIHLKMELRHVVGENIRGFRRLQGLSREDLCKLANINLNHLGAIERGEENVTIDTLNKLGIAMGIEPYAFLTKGCYKWGIKKL